MTTDIIEDESTGDPIAAWHEIVAVPDRDRLDALLADDIVFRSPAVHTPQEGRVAASAYLRAALTVLGPTIAYRREWRAERSAVLEFDAAIEGDDGARLEAQGVDIVAWDEHGRLTEFTVMVRPRRALDALIVRMGEALAAERAR